MDGKDLNDLAAFKISSLSSISDTKILDSCPVDQRWYMFQNMGPSPSGRSGHAMASTGMKVHVLGGESFSPSKGEDASTFHVLDTSPLILVVGCFMELIVDRAHQIPRLHQTACWPSKCPPSQVFIIHSSATIRHVYLCNSSQWPIHVTRN